MIRILTLATCIVVAGCGDKGKIPEAKSPKEVSENKEKEWVPPDIQTKVIEYRSGELVMNGFLAWPRGQSARPGVLVVHEWWGQNDYARKRARMLAEQGYVALAVDMYGGGKVAIHPKDAKTFSGESTKDLEETARRFNAAKVLLQSQEMVDGDKIAAVGYCFGGGIVLHMARLGSDLDGVVSIHGSLAPKSTDDTSFAAKPDTVKAKILVLHGEADPLVPAEQVDAFKQEMTEAGVAFEFVGYPGAKHAFSNPDADKAAAEFGIPVGYDAEADKKSWQAMLQFLGETLSP